MTKFYVLHMRDDIPFVISDGNGSPETILDYLRIRFAANPVMTITDMRSFTEACASARELFMNNQAHGLPVEWPVRWHFAGHVFFIQAHQ